MNKLECLSAYFPHGLKCEILNYKCDYVGEKYGIITGYYTYAGDTHYTFKDKSTAGKSSSLFKPILRPQSDLTKQIEIYGQKFVPVDVLAKILSKTEGCNYNIQEAREWLLAIPVLELPYFIVQKLIKWHFDVFGLIEKKEAVDINTI